MCRETPVWRAIAAIQAMTDRLLAQHDETVRGRGADAYSLTKLGAV